MTRLALEINDLRKTYSGGVEALKGIDLSVEDGDFFALLGPNGAGKSTAIGVVCSLINKTGGSVAIYGRDIDRNFSLAKSHLGLVPQEFNFNMFEKVEDIIVNHAGYYGIERALATRRTEQYLRELGLWDKRRDPARSLSGGMKRRLMIARALVHQPRLLILDEPTAGVDIEIRRSMWEFLRKINREGTTIILTTHYLEEAEMLCRNIAIINQGEIIENTTVKKLLAKMDTETFILDLKQPLTRTPAVNGAQLEVIDSTTLEIDVQKSQGINSVFANLSEQGIEVMGMRNKTNRLEQVFINLVADSSGIRR